MDFKKMDFDFLYKRGIFIITVMLLLGTVLKWCKPWLKQSWLAMKLPGPPVLPIVGNAHLVLDPNSLFSLGNEMSNLYGRIARIWISIIPTFLVVEPDDVQLILSNSRHEKNFLYAIMHTFVGKGMITNNGYKWKKHRKLIQPYFQLNILETFISVFSESAQISVEHLRGKSEINVTRYINECVIDILHCAILGIPIDGDERKKKMDSPFRQGKIAVPYRLTRPWLLIDYLYRTTKLSRAEQRQKKNLHDFVKEILDRKSSYLKGDGLDDKYFKCMLDIFQEIAEKDPSFTEEDIINEATTFMLAGQDSVGAAAAFSLFLMAKHPHIQDKVAEEIKSVFGGYSDKPVSFEDLNNMPYLEQCIRETLRLYPSVPVIARRLVEEITVGKHVLPIGSNVFICPYATHRLPHVYPNPSEFDPRRFSTENIEKLHPYAFLPFSAGPRNCIGYKFAIFELKSILATILRSYELSLKPGYDVTLSYRLTLRAKGGIPLLVKPRIYS